MRVWIALCVGVAVLIAIVLYFNRAEYREDLNYDYNVVQTWPLESVMYGDVVQFESVFWEPDDTVALRELIVEDAIADGRRVLEIGTGTGLIAILCAQNNAKKVVATDISPAAVANARYNAAMLVPNSVQNDGTNNRLIEIRQVPREDPSAFSVIEPKERFDLILSNPPWEDGPVAVAADHAYFDPNFELLESLLDGLPQHLRPGGRCLLAYGHVPAIRRVQEECKQRGYLVKLLDDRKLDELPQDFLPGLLVEIRLPREISQVSDGQFVQPPSKPESP